VKDTKTGECYRADKLLEDFIDNALEKDREMGSARREELRVMAAQVRPSGCVRLPAVACAWPLAAFDEPRAVCSCWGGSLRRHWRASWWLQHRRRQAW
jgi:hypothetical protein